MNTLITAIGLEVHVELKTESKIFCRCAVQKKTILSMPPSVPLEVVDDASLGVDKPNSASCPVCEGQPGVLPALNPEVVKLAARCAVALECALQQRSTFERKHYVYPDLPKNYQITQNDKPIGLNGQLCFEGASGNPVTVRVRRVHMEEDAAKLEHRAIERRRVSLVNFNRCGVPLLEIVSEPDIEDPADAGLYLETLRQIIRWHGISDADMSKGQMRCDANLSVRPSGAPLSESVRWEIKNLNSIEGVVLSLRRAREMQREKLIRSGGLAKDLIQTTFHWDQHKKNILRRREKESGDDYFYFTEPDLMDVCLTPADYQVANESVSVSHEKAIRDLQALKVPRDHVLVITRDRFIYEYWRACSELYADGATLLANVIAGNLRACANSNSITVESLIAGVPAARLVELAQKIDAGEIIRDSELNRLIWVLYERPEVGVWEAAQEMSLTVLPVRQHEQDQKLRLLLDECSAQVNEYLGGRDGVIGFLVGRARKLVPGAKPADLHNALVRLLSERRV